MQVPFHENGRSFNSPSPPTYITATPNSITDTTHPSSTYQNKTTKTRASKVTTMMFRGVLCFVVLAVAMCTMHSCEATRGRVIIRVDHTGKGNYKKIQDAIDSVPSNNNESVLIWVKPGVYKEKIVVPADKPLITLSGTSPANTVVTWDDSGSIFESPTMALLASDLVVRSLTIENSYGEGTKAVALRVSGDKISVIGCRILGYQDTLLDDVGRHYYRSCFIQGATDFICGNAASLFEKCHLHTVSTEAGAITAQSRRSPSENTGFTFLGCKITGIKGGSAVLGRPWGHYSRVVFALTYMTNVVLPQGWDNWRDPSKETTAYFGEYKNYGQGSVKGRRVSWVRNLTSIEAQPFLTRDIVDGRVWIKSVPTTSRGGN